MVKAVGLKIQWTNVLEDSIPTPGSVSLYKTYLIKINLFINNF